MKAQFVAVRSRRRCDACRGPARRVRLALAIGWLCGTTMGGPLSAAGWMQVMGVSAETLHSQDGTTFPAGYLCATAVARADTEGAVVAGYVKPYADHPADVVVLRVQDDGTVRWCREIAVANRNPSTVSVRSDQFAWVATASSAQGVDLVFDDVLVRLTADGVPVLARRYRTAPPDAPAGQLSLRSLTSLPDGGVAACGVWRPLAPDASQRPTTVVLRLDALGAVAWAAAYEALGTPERPQIALSPTGGLILGTQPTAIIALDATNGNVRWARTLASEPFTRGSPTHLQHGRLLAYRSLALAPDGDILFGGDYEIRCPCDHGIGAVVCRLSPDAASIRWTRRVHGDRHGGRLHANAIAATADAVYVAGSGWEFQTPEVIANNNAVAMRWSADGTPRWIRSIGKKKVSVAQSEYRNDLANDIVPTADEGIFVVGGSDAFALPDPGFHRVVEWAQPHYDLLMARIPPDGAIANLPSGRHPCLLSDPDPNDPKEVDSFEPPLRVDALATRALPLAIVSQDVQATARDSALRDVFTTRYADVEAHRPRADFTLTGPEQERGLDVWFDGTLSSDPDGGAILRYEWAFGDGTKSRSAAPKPHHRYPRGGIWSVSLSVWDNQGLCGTNTRYVAVGNVVRGEGIPPMFGRSHLVNYHIAIRTGDSDDAGTDAAVHVALYDKATTNGVPWGSGDLYPYWANALPRGADVFRPGQTSRFEIGPNAACHVDDVDQLLLRHDNSKKRPGWYVVGVTVSNCWSGRQWVFAPDQWLATDEPPDHKTSGVFRPIDPYPRGVLFEGETNAWNLVAASDRVVIVPPGATNFHFTVLDRGAELGVFGPSGVAVGRQYPGGSGRRCPPYFDRPEWGVNVAASSVQVPTRYTVSITKGGGGTLEGVVWVFPSNWVGYETEARRLALLLPMQGRVAEIFAPVVNAQDYLKGAIGTLDLSPVIAYGADAFRIFGSVPDLKLKAYSENQAEGYALTVCGIACSLAGTTASAIAGEFKSILSAMFKAHEWGSALPQVLGLTAAPTYAKGLLTAIADNTDNCGVHLEQATRLFNALETEMTALVKQAETDNDPAACRATLDRIRTLSVGPNPNGPSVADHTIHYADFGVTRCDGLSNELCLGALMAQELELIAKYEGDGHSYFDDAYYQELGFGLDPVEATRTAMSYYEPVIRDLLHVASAFINASLVP